MLKDGAPLQKGALFIEGDSGMLRFIKPGERDFPLTLQTHGMKHMRKAKLKPAYLAFAVLIP